MQFSFLGDAGLDHYILEDELLLGGCSLNVATHFKRNSESEKEALLIFPTIRNNPIEAHCQREAITTHPLFREGELPCQKIGRLPNGEKDFIEYLSGVLHQFQFSSKEREMIAKLRGRIISPLFTQILPLIDQVLEINHSVDYIFDFHSAEDFAKDYDQLYPYLERCNMAQFGLSNNRDDQILKSKLIDHAKKSSTELLITEGSSEIYFYDGESEYRFMPELMKDVVDTTGAGDSFLGAFLAKREMIPVQKALEEASLYTHQILSQRGSL